MSQHTKIEWADHTWSPWRGCTKVSPGCANCYAETLSKRNPAVLGQWGKGKPRVLAKNWDDPMRWNKKEESELVGHAEFARPERPRVFPSLCDWLDEEVPVSWLADFLALVMNTPNLDWLLLTKRPENWEDRSLKAAQALADTAPAVSHWLAKWRRGIPPGNVWFGVSVEDQIRANERIPLLLDIPAQIRWLSVEPLLGPVVFTTQTMFGSACLFDEPVQSNVGRSKTGTVKLGIHWVVVGGESGPGARKCQVSWIRSVKNECLNLRVPIFVKQLGSNPWCTVTKGKGPPDDFRAISHPKGGNPSEWPNDLRVRQFPNPAQ